MGAKGVKRFSAVFEAGAGAEAPPFRALRTESHLFAEYKAGGRELCDLRRDPAQLTNLVDRTSAAELDRFAVRLRELQQCKGDGCRQLENAAIDGGL